MFRAIEEEDDNNAADETPPIASLDEQLIEETQVVEQPVVALHAIKGRLVPHSLYLEG